MERQQLSPDIVQRARQYLAQGLRIGTEHADSRRYRSGVWQTCSPIDTVREFRSTGRFGSLSGGNTLVSMCGCFGIRSKGQAAGGFGHDSAPRRQAG